MFINLDSHRPPSRRRGFQSETQLTKRSSTHDLEADKLSIRSRLTLRTAVSRSSTTNRETSKTNSAILEEPRVRGSVRNEITNLFFETMLDNIVQSWEVTEVKGDSKSQAESEIEIHSGKKKRMKDRDEENKGDRRIGSRVNIMAPKQRKKQFSREPSNFDMSSTLLQTTWWSVPDETAIIHFKNGNVYEGDISSKCMHGDGRYTWADGTVYTGSFKDNKISGRGTIEWKNDTWYHGEFYGNVRHGKGLYVDSRQQRYYCGDWYFGVKHGNGIITYSKDHKNSYDGDWVMNVPHGHGVREYNEHSVYYGEFNCGTREGKGEIIWPNHDYYNGDWKNGTIDGKGQYIWGAYRNDTMCAPRVISYKGTWLNGERHGHGHCQLGPVWCSHYVGQFEHNKKHGKGHLITRNGIFVVDERLFDEDNLQRTIAGVTLKQNKPESRSPRSPKRSLEIPLISDMVFRYHIDNAVKKCYNDESRVQRRNCIANYFYEKSKEHKPVDVSEVQSICLITQIKQFTEDRKNFEDICLQKAVVCYQEHITNIYGFYAVMCNKQSVNFPYLLIRLYLWQFFYDCNFNEKDLTLAQIDTMLWKNKSLRLNDPHDPFEHIYIWQFIHGLIMLSSHFYVKSFPGPKPDTMVASAFRKFMDKDILPHAGICKGRLAKYNFLPLKPLYELYLSLGKQPTVRKFLSAARRCPHKYMFEAQPPLKEANEKHLPRGKNCYLHDLGMVYIRERGYCFKPDPCPDDRDPNFPLYNIGNLSSKCILLIFLHSLPNLMQNGKIMNIDTEITFLEFFEALVACSEENIYRRRVIEDSSLYTKFNEEIRI